MTIFRCYPKGPFLNNALLICFLLFLVSSISIQAQTLPRFDGDTLYTASGFKIFKGQLLHFTEGTGKNGHFRFVKFKGSDNPKKLTNRTIEVRKISDYYISGLDNAYIRIKGAYTKKNGSIKIVRFKMLFEKAIQGFMGSTPELKIPDEFIKAPKPSVINEITRLHQLLESGAITQQEFDLLKKKLITE
ncbi:MAG: SHOCT domain-containing protein [Bacteroidetes bacterium]|nr:SHOCT domain-containing protein [Bacteroidota bacterium]